MSYLMILRVRSADKAEVGKTHLRFTMCGASTGKSGREGGDSGGWALELSGSFFTHRSGSMTQSPDIASL